MFFLQKFFLVFAVLALSNVFINTNINADEYDYEEGRYETILTKHLTMNQEYPISGKLYGLDGDAIVRLQINQEGVITNHKIVHSTGHKILDDSINEMLEIASPAPIPPIEYFEDNTDVIEFMIPIAFRTNDNINQLQEIDELFQDKVKKAWQ